jgi:hypothetical protein
MNRKLVVGFILSASVALTLAVCQEAQAQRFGRGGGRGMGAMLPDSVSTVFCVQIPGAQKELKLDEATTDKVKNMIREYRDEARKEREGGSDMATLRKKLDGEYAPKLAAILDKTQQTRLREIAIQVAGVHALQDATVVKDLDLTKEQQDKIAGIVKEHGEHAGGGGAAAFMEHRREQLDKAVAVLTKDQQEKFEKMKGKPFTFSPPAGRSGGRRARTGLGAPPGAGE